MTAECPRMTLAIRTETCQPPAPSARSQCLPGGHGPGKAAVL